MSLAGQGVDAGRKAIDGVITTAENFARTMDNLNQTTSRINSLLDEIEEPLRRLLAQAGPSLSALATMAESANTLAELAKRLNPLGFVAGASRGTTPERPAS